MTLLLRRQVATEMCRPKVGPGVVRREGTDVQVVKPTAVPLASLLRMSLPTLFGMPRLPITLLQTALRISTLALRSFAQVLSGQHVPSSSLIRYLAIIASSFRQGVESPPSLSRYVSSGLRTTSFGMAAWCQCARSPMLTLLLLLLSHLGQLTVCLPSLSLMQEGVMIGSS